MKWKPLLFYGEVKELRLIFSLCVTMNLRDRVGKIVRMKSLENENLKKTKIRNDFESEMPQNWKWMKIWKMTILNDQTKEWFWIRNASKLKINENLKDENFKWPKWGMILKQKCLKIGSERKMTFFGDKIFWKCKFDPSDDEDMLWRWLMVVIVDKWTCQLRWWVDE